jgi:nitrite reductase/ring-hydroxylating ferredoxin subunit
MAWATLCTLDELTEGRAKGVSIDGYTLAIYLDNGHPSVIDDTCPHAGASLSNGFVDDGCAVCPYHYWAFSLATGELRDNPGVKVSRYPVRLHPFNGKQFVQADLPST